MLYIVRSITCRPICPIKLQKHINIARIFNLWKQQFRGDCRPTYKTMLIKCQSFKEQDVYHNASVSKGS